MGKLYAGFGRVNVTPMLDKNAEGALEKDYYQTVYHKMADVA